MRTTFIQRQSLNLEKKNTQTHKFQEKAINTRKFQAKTHLWINQKLQKLSLLALTKTHIIWTCTKIFFSIVFGILNLFILCLK